MVSRVFGLVLLLAGTAILINDVVDLVDTMAQVERESFSQPVVTRIAGLAIAVSGAIVWLRTKKPSDQISILGSSK